MMQTRGVHTHSTKTSAVCIAAQHQIVSPRPLSNLLGAHPEPSTLVAEHKDASSRRLILATAPVALLALTQSPPAKADDFTVTTSGLRYLDIKVGSGKQPQVGDVCVVHWSGYTKVFQAGPALLPAMTVNVPQQGYQGKRIDNTSTRDEPYEFVLGGGSTIRAFEEAVSSMRVGGVRRVEVPGEQEDLGYPRDRSLRFTDQPITGGKIFQYRYGPQPAELGGQRALDFVLDNPTLRPFNRDLLFDIKLLSVRAQQ